MLAIGASHVACVIRAAEVEGVPLNAIWLREYERAEALDGGVLADALRRDLDAMLARDPSPILFGMVGSQRSAQLATFRHPQPFDFILPGHEELPLDPEAELIPYAPFAMMLAWRASKATRLMRAIVAHSGRRVVQFLDPPPPESFRWKTDARKEAKEAGLRPSSALFRLKVWLAANRAFERACRSIGVEPIQPPAEALDARGFLDERFRQDGVHGNLDYGRLQLARMKAMTA